MHFMDRQDPATLDDLDEFRSGKFNHLYFCRDCARSFDAVGEVEICKFCDGGNVQKISSRKERHVRYRYYCPVCEKNFTTSSKIKNCEFCGSKHIHIRASESISRRDEFRTRLWHFFGGFMKRYDEIGKEKPRTAKERKIFRLEKIRIKKPEFRMPEFRLFRSSRDEEELPTR